MLQSYLISLRLQLLTILISQAGDILATSAEADVKAASDLGFSAFAINLNADALNSDWSDRCTQRLFDAAASNPNKFKCFISMDLNNADDRTRDRFHDYVNRWMSHPAYYKHDNKPMLSTFSVGRTSPSNWPGFLGSLNGGGGVYFLPETDNANGYYAYNQPAGSREFWDSWAPVVDGVFSWETAWCKDGKNNVSTSDWDEPHAAEAHRRQKSYMVPMSTLQYKHWAATGDNWYRVGEVNLPERMTEVLSMNPQPDFAEVITWNDSGESHYIGTVHTDGQIAAFREYSNEETYSHTAWQPLYQSFIQAFKDNVDARGMKPTGQSKYTGAMWFRGVTSNAQCSDRPSGAEKAKDAVNWAIIAAPDTKNAYVQVYSNGKKILEPVQLHAGLNYGSVPGLVAGRQYIEVFETDNVNGGTWDYKYTRTGDVAVSSNTNGGLCNYNYLVYGLKEGRNN